MTDPAPQANLFDDENPQGSPKPQTSPNPKLRDVNRQQNVFRCVEIESLIPEDHEARAIWDFIGRLSLERFFHDIRTFEGEVGRATFSPRVLISVWVYAYCRGIGSAREVSRLCDFDPAFQWLTGMNSINHHTLSDFRVDHQDALNQFLVEVLGILSAEGLITLKFVAHDGTKIKANASGKSFRREGRLREHLDAARKQVEGLNDASAEEVSSRRRRSAEERVSKLEKALQELEKLRKGKKGAEEKAQARVSETDPEARIMKQGDGGFSPSFNVQVSTDSESGMIVGVRVTQAGNDHGELVSAVEEIKKNLGSIPEKMAADGGYTTHDNINAMAGMKIDFIGSLPQSANTCGLKKYGIEPEFHAKAFSYDSATDTFTCPHGEKLTLSWMGEVNGQKESRYFAPFIACQACPFKVKCCPTNLKTGRSIVRTQPSPEVAKFKEKMDTDGAKSLYRRRAPLAEFSNLWIKVKSGLRQFFCRGLEKVTMEVKWVAIATNIRRWILQGRLEMEGGG